MEAIEGITGFIEQIFNLPRDEDTVTVYRGHADTEYALVPSIFRENAYAKYEDRLIREMISNHPEEFDRDRTTLELLVRMQHYALPTRLLDVTLNPLVALYFAAQEVKRSISIKINGQMRRRMSYATGEVVALHVPLYKVKYNDSDTVSCLSNMAHLTEGQKAEIYEGIYDDTLEFNASPTGQRLHHFVMNERNHFDRKIDPRDLVHPVLVKPKLNNKRIVAQNGAFFVFGNQDEINIHSSNKIGVDRIRIPSANKDSIVDELDRLNINEKTLFPEIERTARYLSTESKRSLDRRLGDLFD